MDVTKDARVLFCFTENQRIREANEYRRPKDREPVPGEAELFQFLISHVEREMKVYKSEGGDPKSLVFLTWIDKRPLDRAAIAELTEKVPYHNPQIVALAMWVTNGLFRFEATEIDPLDMRVRSTLDL